MDTELELFAKLTLEQGGEWFLLEQSEMVSLYESKTKWCDGRNYFYNHPVFHIFNAEGKRLHVTSSYATACQYYNTVIELIDKCYPDIKDYKEALVLAIKALELQDGIEKEVYEDKVKAMSFTFDKKNRKGE